MSDPRVRFPELRAVLTALLLGCVCASEPLPAQEPGSWFALFGGPGRQWPGSRGLVVDDEGHVFVASRGLSADCTRDDSLCRDFVTLKYDAAGKEVWRAVYDGGDGDWPSALGLDRSGNVYVTGWSYGGRERRGREDIATVKYDPEGRELWVSRYGEPTDREHGPRDLLVDERDESAYVYVVGHHSLRNIVTIKYAGEDGKELWSRQWEGQGHKSSAHRVAVGCHGDIYVAGRTSAMASLNDYAVLKYDPHGNLAWDFTYDGPAGDNDAATDIVVDACGRRFPGASRVDAPPPTRDVIYVTGYSRLHRGLHEFGFNFDYALVTLKLDADGELLWMARFEGPAAGSGNDTVSLALDRDGNVYVSGTARVVGTDRTEFVTVAYDSEGRELWVARFSPDKRGKSGGERVVLDPAANSIHVTGEAAYPRQYDVTSLTYDLAGNLTRVGRFHRSGQQHARDTFIDEAGNVYVTAQATGLGGWDTLTLKNIPVVVEIPYFLRGDCNGDGEVGSDVSDAIFLLAYNFRGGEKPPCLAACDADGDGAVVGQVSDAVYLLTFIFRGGPAPVAPFPECGTDPELECLEPSPACE